MPATLDQNLVPNAVAEFHAAKDVGKSDTEAWAATVARIRYDVLRMAITTLAAGEIRDQDCDRSRCIQELSELQGSYEGEPDKPI